jgi:hypothetical protein
VESAFIAFFALFFLLSMLFVPAIFSYMALPYFFMMMALLAVGKFYSSEVIFFAPVIFFIAYFLEIHLSNISFTINTPWPTGKNVTGNNKEDHTRIKRLIIVHYIMIIYIIMVLSYYAYQ